MGKDSLIKSTGTKSASKKKQTAAKKTASKKAAPAKSTKGTGTKAKSSKSAPKKAVTKATIKDLIFKTFESNWPPAAAAPPAPDVTGRSAPPFINSDDPGEVQRLRALLFQRYSMAEIRAAAIPPEKRQPAAEPEPLPEAIAEAAPVPAPEAPESPAPQPSAETTTDETTPDDETTGVEPTPQATTAALPPQREPVPEPPDRSPPPELPPATNGSSDDPVLRAMKIGGAVLALVAALIIWASFANSVKYYAVAERDGVTVWRGAFSPTGKRVVAVLPNLQLEEPVQSVYNRKEIYPLVFQYYLDRANAEVEAAGLPDLDAVKGLLDQGEQYVLNREMGAAVQDRRNALRRIQLIHQAHVEISKGTAASLDAALGHLKQAQRLTDDSVQLEAIDRIVTLVDQRRAERQAETDAAPAGE